MDKFQQRYLEHKERKQRYETEDYTIHTQQEYDLFIKFLNSRRSQRTFNKIDITDEELNKINEAIKKSPSSCNRGAIYLKEMDIDDADKYLVGAKKWVLGANRVFLVFGDKTAYKNPIEVDFMPYLDAGFVCQNIYLMCEALNIGCCFINPNIREENKQDFVYKYRGDYLCGAIALGHYDKKAIKPPERNDKQCMI